jgi:hypothetical protein
MISGIHFLLSYSCTFECDHCFLYCSPQAQGTFTRRQIETVLDDAKKRGVVKGVCFEGGEPFLFHPLLVEGVRMAKERGFRILLVTNAYWATNAEDAELWLKPLAEIGIDDLSLSDDAFHQGDDEALNTARRAYEAAKKLGMPVGDICIEAPKVGAERTDEKGDPIIGGNVRFRGRAVEKLIEGLPLTPPEQFVECKDEELEKPGRVHLDCYGNVHMCQGISMGNMWETPLSELDASYDAHSHPICGPLLKGGPVQLAKEYGVSLADGYVDACHMCFEVRKALLDRFPEQLAPKQVYGL